MFSSGDKWLPITLLLLPALTAAAGARAQEGMLWRELAPENTVYMELSEGTVIFELNPLFAPQAVEQFTRLVKEGFYRGLSFYRVIDGFVAQAGDESDVGGPRTQPGLKAEFERKWDKAIPWARVELGDPFAAETGFVDGFAAARDPRRVWLVHCPGVLAMARNNEPDSGSTDFYIVIGQAPRYLDRNLTIFGRVVYGMDTVQRIRRGPVDANGMIDGDEDRSRILAMRMAEDVDPAARKALYVMDTNSSGFREYLEARRNRDHEFFHHKPPAVLDVCQVPIGTRAEKPDLSNHPLNPAGAD